MSSDINDYLVDLTEEDEHILESYSMLCDSLSLMLGEGYEIVLHSLGRNDYFIRKIINGHYSNRRAHEQPESYPLRALAKARQAFEEGSPAASIYFSENSRGQIFRTSTLGIAGSGGRLIGMICFNFSLDTPVSSLIRDYYPYSDPLLRKSPEGADMSEVIHSAVAAAEEAVMNDASVPPKYRKKEIIRRLNDSGIFGMKDSVSLVAGMLHLRISTVYMHLRNLQDNNNIE